MLEFQYPTDDIQNYRKPYQNLISSYTFHHHENQLE